MKAIIKWFSELFSNLFGIGPAKTAARLAGVYVTASHPGEVALVLPLLKAGLERAKDGTMDRAMWDRMLALIIQKVGDEKLESYIREFISYPDFVFGEIDTIAIKLTESFIEGLEAGK